MTDTPKWSVYVLRCVDASLYTGIAINVAARLVKHNTNRGSKYVAAHRPACLVQSAGPYTRSTATRLEQWVKSLPPADKLLAIQQLHEQLIDVHQPELTKR